MGNSNDHGREELGYSYCPWRMVVTSLTYWAIFIFFNFKLSAVWPWLWEAEYAVLFNLGAFIVVNGYIYATFGFLYITVAGLCIFCS